MAQETDRSLVRSITDAMNEFATLFQTEMRLVRAELSEKASRLATSGTMIGAGAVAAIVGIVLLLQDLVKWLAIAGLPEEWGLLLVGGLITILAIVLLMKGINDAKT